MEQHLVRIDLTDELQAAQPITLTLRSGERVGARRAAVGRVRGLYPENAFYQVMAFVPVQQCSWLASNRVGKRPLTLPLLRNGSLPLPAEAGRGYFAEAE